VQLLQPSEKKSQSGRCHLQKKKKKGPKREIVPAGRRIRADKDPVRRGRMSGKEKKIFRENSKARVEKGKQGNRRSSMRLHP